jgi:hypothetical protein
MSEHSQRWKKVVKKRVVVAAREATAADEELIRTTEKGVLEKFGLRAYADLWPHYMILRGVRDEEYPCEKGVFEETYDELGEEVG